MDVYDTIPQYSVKCKNLHRQLSVILKTAEPSFHVRHIDVQRQVGDKDCGLFALAFAFAICSGVSPYTLALHQPGLRLHLLECFEQMAIAPFPMKTKSRRVGSLKPLCLVETAILFTAFVAYHGTKEDSTYGPLVYCSTCKKWYHKHCCNIANKYVTSSCRYTCSGCVAARKT